MRDLFTFFVFAPIAYIVVMGAMTLAAHILKMQPGKDEPLKVTVFSAVGLAGVLLVFWLHVQLGL